MADEYLRLFRDGHREELSKALLDGKIASCGGALLAALLQSGLVDAMRPCLASASLLSAWGEHERTVYYGAFSYN
jgi:hypothetical protein